MSSNRQETLADESVCQTVPELGVEGRLWSVGRASPSGSTTLQEPEKKKRWGDTESLLKNWRDKDGNLHVSWFISIALVYVVGSWRETTCQNSSPTISWQSDITLTSLWHHTQLPTIQNQKVPNEANESGPAAHELKTISHRFKLRLHKFQVQTNKFKSTVNTSEATSLKVHRDVETASNSCLNMLISDHRSVSNIFC